jgi:hypothetical protein
MVKPPTHKPTVRVPAAIEVAIEAQRDSLETAISLLYCLHSALRREIDDAGKIESDAVEAASKSADLTDLSAMLLVQLDAIDRALDPEELAEADPDPEIVAIAEAARKMRGDSSDEEDAS